MVKTPRQNLNATLCTYRAKLETLAALVEKERAKVDELLARSALPAGSPGSDLGSTHCVDQGWEPAVSVIRYASRVDALHIAAFDAERDC